MTSDDATLCRVLIFSQMVRLLDVISDYMRLRGFQHQRLDGSTPGTQRHQVPPHPPPLSLSPCLFLSLYPIVLEC